MTSILPETDVLLRDGATVHVRPIESDDLDAMREFLDSLSEDSRRLRYFSGGANMDWAAAASVGVHLPDSYGIVAVRAGYRIVAHATYGRSNRDRAEVAFAVADEMHGLGIATTLLAHLAEQAEASGIGWFEARVLPGNSNMLEVFRDSGFDVRTRSRAGVIEIEFPTTLPACSSTAVARCAGLTGARP
jgi:GNAT superfamily N-acetyltransferase